MSARTRLLAAWIAALAAACGSPDPPAGARDASLACATDEDCDDGLFCTGLERCDGARACIAAPSGPCLAGQTCDEVLDRCAPDCAVSRDADGDGRPASACGGDDCDDADARRAPGHDEVCDAGDVDEDCDPATFGSRDADGDGFVDARCCNDGPGGSRACGDDCDDAAATAHRGLGEICNGRDDDCDGSVDEAVLRELRRDADGDGHAARDGERVLACSRPDGYAEVADDCDDDDPAAHPLALEVCDEAARDEDCDGAANPGALCDCTGVESRACVAEGPCAAGVEVCVGGRFTACSVRPRSEICNLLDDDCDGAVDETVAVTCYADVDNDGVAAADATAVLRCPVSGREPAGGCPTFLTNAPPVAPDVDCTDDDASIRPGAAETCDARDEDCDGSTDEGTRLDCYADRDADGYAALSASATPLCPAAAGACPAGWTTRVPGAGTADCGEGVPLAHPQAASSPPFSSLTDAFCADGQGPCTSSDGARRCRPSPTDACTTALPAASWDYNCDGRLDPPPRGHCQPCCCITTFEDCYFACGTDRLGGCGPGGWASPSAAGCGTPQPFLRCATRDGCDADFAACETSSALQLMPCR